MPSVASVWVLATAILAAACGKNAATVSHSASVSPAASAVPTGLVLGADEGERRIRIGMEFPFVIKVDQKNGGSPDLVMLYEDLPPQHAIPPHHHLLADEIVFVHSGSGIACVGSVTKEVSAGSTIYIPRNTRVAIRNSGTVPMTIAAIFSKPGFEQMLREMSVVEGEPNTPPSRAELTRAVERAASHTVYDQSPGTEAAKSARQPSNDRCS